MVLEVEVGWALLGRLDIARDVYYFWPHGLRSAYQVGAGQLFLVGDNPPASRDSRDYLAIGDSVMKGAANELTSRGYTVLAEESRQMIDMVPVMQEFREAGVFDRSVDVRVTRLRHKIEDEPSRPRYIRTVWGVGYQFTPEGNSP